MPIQGLQSVMNMSLIVPETQANNSMHLGRHQIPPVRPNESLRPGDGKRSKDGLHHYISGTLFILLPS